MRGMLQAAGTVVAAMNEAPHARHYVADLTISTGLGFATIYRAVAHLERKGIVTSDWDPPVREDGPRRRHYQLVAEATECRT